MEEGPHPRACRHAIRGSRGRLCKSKAERGQGDRRCYFRRGRCQPSAVTAAETAAGIPEAGRSTGSGPLGGGGLTGARRSRGPPRDGDRTGRGHPRLGGTGDKVGVAPGRGRCPLAQAAQEVAGGAHCQDSRDCSGALMEVGAGTACRAALGTSPWGRAPVLGDCDSARQQAGQGGSLSPARFPPLGGLSSRQRRSGPGVQAERGGTGLQLTGDTARGRPGGVYVE